MYSRSSAKKGLDAALKHYLQYGTEFYAITLGKPAAKWQNVIEQNWSGKIEDVEDVAEKIKARFEDCDYSENVYYLLWWDSKPEMDKGKPLAPASDSISFMTATNEAMENRRAEYQANFGYVNNQIISRLSAIEEKLNKEEEEGTTVI